MFLLYLMLFLVNIIGIKSELASCQQTFGANKYDLNRLSHLTIAGEDTIFGYAFTPCGLVPTSECGSKTSPFEPGMTGCEKLIIDQSDPVFQSPLGFLDGYGKTPNLEFTENTDGPGTGVIMTMRNAECVGTARNLLVKATFICDESVKIPKTMYIHESPVCDYVIQIKAAGACPIKPGGAGGTVFVILLLVLVVVYLVGGVLYNRVKHNQTGLAMLPHKSFWLNLFGLFLSGCRITLTFVRTCGKESTYSSV